MRHLAIALVLLAALPLTAACAGSGNSGAGGAASTGQTGSSMHVVKKSDAGTSEDAGPEVESTSAGW